MSSPKLLSTATTLLVASLVVFAVFDFSNHPVDSLRGLLFWWVTLVVASGLIVGGNLIRRRHLNFGTTMLIVGALMALIPTGKTLVLPLLALGVIVLALREHTAQQRVF